MQKVIQTKVLLKARPPLAAPAVPELTLEHQLELALNPDRHTQSWSVKKGDLMVFLTNINQSVASAYFKAGDVVRSDFNQEWEDNRDTERCLSVTDIRIEDKQASYYRKVMTPLNEAPVVKELLKKLGRDLPEAEQVRPPAPPVVYTDLAISYARGPSMVAILEHFSSCHTPREYAAGYPPDAAAAQVWEDCLLGRKNPQGQPPQYYWVSTMINNAFNDRGARILVEEMTPEMKKYRKEHGTDNRIVMTEFLRIMPWSRLEAELIKNNEWKPSEEEKRKPHNAAPTVAKEPYMPTLNQTLILNAIFNFLNNVGERNGLKLLPQGAGFLENLENMEEFVKQNGSRAGVTFEPHDTVEDRLWYLERLCIDNAAQIGVPYLKPQAQPASTVGPTEQLNHNELCVRVGILEDNIRTLEAIIKAMRDAAMGL